MGTSTDGRINYGILFEEDFQFPWDEDEKYDGDIEQWWMYKVHGYKNPIELFDESISSQRQILLYIIIFDPPKPGTTICI